MLIYPEMAVADEIDALEAAAKSRGRPELLIQRSVIAFVKQCVRGGLAFHVPNEAGTSAGRDRNFRLARHRAGVVSGVPDLFVCWPAGSLFYGEKGEAWAAGNCWLEVKAPKGKGPSDQQLHAHALLRDAGQRVAVVRSIGDAEAALRSFGAPVMTTPETKNGPVAAGPSIVTKGDR